jgi:hypothetical protein
MLPKQLTQHQQLPQPHSLTTDQFGSLIKVIKNSAFKSRIFDHFLLLFQFLLKETQKAHISAYKFPLNCPGW